MSTVYFLPKSEKDFARLPKKEKVKIEKVIKGISQNPFVGKKLGGELLGLYVARAWPYRILYKFEKTFKAVIIVHILHRQEAYK
ncbi:type II toxin-antitoxin system RelE/ParE family toxin [Candidatus Gottesmanbacteria bacterium]|nr:type II toxin-antitoxin system RelE/ParE family toxin [Candidatus Gottesmanbacteria bacterium]MBI5465044.1 type II toxin-antitoxin system RelE/ParE family toxin [Candidatus Gottesmanbacteria bacterium]